MYAAVKFGIDDQTRGVDFDWVLAYGSSRLDVYAWNSWKREGVIRPIVFEFVCFVFLNGVALFFHVFDAVSLLVVLPVLPVLLSFRSRCRCLPFRIRPFRCQSRNRCCVALCPRHLLPLDQHLNHCLLCDPAVLDRHPVLFHPDPIASEKVLPLLDAAPLELR